ncbi:hypothetical protein BT69DRAFT_1346533 [Atractiella rhizophila]|nr:hypothetical protein BT69DRAFT_1346533 [Atractiella rhizophila]
MMNNEESSTSLNTSDAELLTTPKPSTSTSLQHDDPSSPTPSTSRPSSTSTVRPMSPHAIEKTLTIEIAAGEDDGRWVRALQTFALDHGEEVHVGVQKLVDQIKRKEETIQEGEEADDDDLATVSGAGVGED